MAATVETYADEHRSELDEATDLEEHRGRCDEAAVGNVGREALTR